MSTLVSWIPFPVYDFTSNFLLIPNKEFQNIHSSILSNNNQAVQNNFSSLTVNSIILLLTVEVNIAILYRLFLVLFKNELSMCHKISKEINIFYSKWTLYCFAIRSCRDFSSSLLMASTPLWQMWPAHWQHVPWKNNEENTCALHQVVWVWPACIAHTQVSRLPYYCCGHTAPLQTPAQPLWHHCRSTEVFELPSLTC